MQSEAETVDEYLAELPDERRDAIETVRTTVLENLPDGYEEVMQHGMISYVVPLDDYPTTYNGKPLVYASLASQKNHMAVYLMSVYGDAESDFREKYESTGRRLDMGKCCVRFRKLDNLPLDVVGDEIARLEPAEFIAMYEDARSGSKRK